MRRRTGLPPGSPYSLSPLNTLRYFKSPTDFYRSAAKRYGDTFTINLAGSTHVVTSNPEAIKAIFTASTDVFVPQTSDVQIPFIGPTSLLRKGGDEHKRLRKLLGPPFQGNRMRAYGDMMREAGLARMAQHESGAPFSFKNAAEDMLVTIILKVMFGTRNERLIEEFGATLLDFFRTAMNPAVAFFPLLRRRWFGFGPWARLQDTGARLDKLIYDDLAERRRTGSSGDDVISLLLSARDDDGRPMSDVEIRDQFYTFALAGNETSAMTLSWALYWLHRYPAMLERLRAELDQAGADCEPDKVAKLPYLELVIKETLRLYPNVIDVPRRLAKPLQLLEYTIPAGYELAVPIVLVHEREDIYPDPFRFDPERFARRTPTPFEYLPFGGGFRRCAGGAMAEYQLKVILAALVTHYEFECLEQRLLKPALRTVTTGPEGDLMFRIVRRRTPASTRDADRTAITS